MEDRLLVVWVCTRTPLLGGGWFLKNSILKATPEMERGKEVLQSKTPRERGAGWLCNQ